MDKRLIKVNPIDKDSLKKMQLQWYAHGENYDYIAPYFVKLGQNELKQFYKASEDLQALGIRAAKYVVQHNLWRELHIPKSCRELITYSLNHELDNNLISRFDFAGGLDGLPIKLLEFNADTCTLIPETLKIQNAYYNQERSKLNEKPYNKLYDDLVSKLRYLLNKYPQKEPNFLITTMGNQEDWLNTDIIEQAAKDAGFHRVQSLLLEKVIFSPDEGIFMELSDEEFVRFDFWYKMVPWEYMAYEEPGLLNIVDNIVRNDLAVVLNPAWTMLLQSKAIQKIMLDLEPSNPNLLPTKLTPTFDVPYFGKPTFGRLGENIKVFSSDKSVIYETQGDHGAYPLVYQEATKLNMDSANYRYQPSMFWTGTPSAFAIRRQDDLVIDDDTEFVAHTVYDDYEP